MPARTNTVNYPPTAVAIALQYWRDDMADALRLARLISDIETRRRDDVIFALCPRFDLERTREQQETFMHVAGKFPSMFVPSRREGTGHPDGAAALWSSTVEQLSEAWWAGRSQAHSVFTIEADGCPLRADWIDRLLEAHRRTLEVGKRVTGALMNEQFRHINGSLCLHLSTWQDRPSLHRTPSGQAWDLFHAAVLTSEARPTPWIKNCYGAGSWSAESLEIMARETAWLSSSKDDSAIAWAERSLVARAGAAT